MWNVLISESNKERKKQLQEEWNKKKELLEKLIGKVKEEVKKFNDETPKLYKIKDRFFKIYPIFLTIFVVWLVIAILLFIAGQQNILFFILLFIYGIFTLPIALISLLVPVIKFVAVDLKGKIQEVKVWASAQYIVAIFFTENRILDIGLFKIDNEHQFEYKKLPYVVDKSASFLTTSKIMVSYYVKGIPNPLKFNFRTYIEEYAKRLENPKFKATDWEGKEIDVAFSSENLKDYKKSKLFAEFFRDYLGEANKLIYAILGIMGLVMIVFLVAYILK